MMMFSAGSVFGFSIPMRSNEARTQDTFAFTGGFSIPMRGNETTPPKTAVPNVPVVFDPHEG